MLKCYKIIIETLAPVHIGSGQEIKKSEYVYDKANGMLYIMDTYKLFEGLKKLNLLDRFEEFMLTSREATMTDFIAKNGINQYKDWAAYSYNVGKFGKYTNPIKGFIKDAYGLPYVPGSSLKGVIRNALLSALLRQKKENYLVVTQEVLSEIENGKPNNKFLLKQSSDLDVMTFHSVRNDKNGEPAKKTDDAVNSKMRGLIISDSKPISKEHLIVCKKEDMTKNGETKSISLLRECISPKTELEFTMTIDTNVFKYSADTLEKVLNYQHTFIKQNFNDVFGSRAKTDSMSGTLLYLGGGTGYVSKTATYSLFYKKDDNTKSVKETSKILHKVFYKKNMSPKAEKMSSHINDFKELGISPRVRKCTSYKGEIYDMGLCRINIQEI